jgi:hypothetical protein
MTTDTAVLERALMVMAASMVIQTILFIAVAVAGVMAWRRTTEALREAKAQVAELRVYLDRMSARVDEASGALIRGTAAVDDVVSDVRDAMGTVRNSVGNVASMVSGPKTALAVGLMKGVQVWRKRRAAQRLAAAGASEL